MTPDHGRELSSHQSWGLTQNHHKDAVLNSIRGLQKARRCRRVCKHVSCHRKIEKPTLNRATADLDQPSETMHRQVDSFYYYRLMEIVCYCFVACVAHDDAFSLPEV